MLSKIYLLNRSALPILAKGSLCSSYNNVQSLKRNYRVRTFVYEQSTMEQSPTVSQSDAKTPLSTEEQKPVEEANEIQNAAVYQSDTTSVNYTDICEKQLLQDNNRSPYSDLARESDNIYRRISGQEELHEIPSVGKENVSVLSFEDEYFRLKDEATHRFLEDDVDDTLDRANSCHPDEEVMFVKQDDAGAFFDRILSMDENEVLTEREKKLISIIREEKKAEKKDIKRNTWFNFMPAKEKPEGMFGTYSPDQIFSSLVFDLLSRNANEVYKYEKDDMFLNEEILKHTKLPEDIEPPKIPLYPNFEEYAKWVTFAVNRNGDYSMEEKKKVVDILQQLGSLQSDVDDSPKVEFKQKKYL